ncbi:hypothetical protein BGX23_002603 [Mortierella sp. AD031]|nr:hypothetical protein BGX23_002603 [Mortierella sp. AD031]KAG0212105.1 hypothetical protein BGX33_003876 [Mortierella sp. NVP41]
MAPSISHTVESESQITPASLKASSTEDVHLLQESNPLEAPQEPTSVDPLATTTSVPSSDDDMDDGSIDGTADTASDAGADVTVAEAPAAVVVAAADVAADATTTTIEVLADASDDDFAADEEVAAVARSFAEGISLKDDRTETAAVKSSPSVDEIERAQTSSPSSSPQPIESSSPAQVQSKETSDVKTSSTTTTTTTTQEITAAAAAVVGEQEVRKPLSRPLSRQDLRRKSSFFNSKEIAISDQRFSSSTSASMRPIADPRFKNRFQNILSQWKARASE